MKICTVNNSNKETKETDSMLKKNIPCQEISTKDSNQNSIHGS